MRQPADLEKLLSQPVAATTAKRRPQYGVTTIELLVSIVLMGIVLSLALPSYREMIEKRRLTQGAEQIFAFVNSMQGVASRSNQAVTVSYSRTGERDWCVGATRGTAACDCTESVTTEADYCAIDGSDARITNDHVGNAPILEAMNGDGSYAYDPVRGLMVDLNDSLDIELHSPSDDYQMRLIVSNTGHAVLCSKDANHKVPGYSVCPTQPSAEEES